MERTSFKCHEHQPVVECTRQDVYHCGEFKHDICKTFTLPGHLRYMQNEEPKKANDKLLFYDFETDQNSGEHIVNFVLAWYANGTEFVLEGYHSIDQFCKFSLSSEHKGFIAVAHNAKSFDAI